MHTNVSPWQTPNNTFIEFKPTMTVENQFNKFQVTKLTFKFELDLDDFEFGIQLIVLLYF